MSVDSNTDPLERHLTPAPGDAEEQQAEKGLRSEGEEKPVITNKSVLVRREEAESLARGAGTSAQTNDSSERCGPRAEAAAASGAACWSLQDSGSKQEGRRRREGGPGLTRLTNGSPDEQA